MIDFQEHGKGMNLLLPIVTTSDLSRTPRRVLNRIARGERFIVCCHGRPLATLQPLDGIGLATLHRRRAGHLRMAGRRGIRGVRQAQRGPTGIVE
ncbi:MAG TPA: hypothetical protein VFD47_10120 [Actinomycetota bacterium]|nr:hypothetical protein [Actinomycetota bacterium]